MTSRTGKKFLREMKEIQAKRFQTIDKDLPRPTSFERLTDAIPSFEEEWNRIKKGLELEPRKENLFKKKQRIT